MGNTAVKDKANGMPPERALAQRIDALVTANEVRTKRAYLKKDIKGGRKKIQDLIESPPDYILTMKVFDLCLAAPKHGRVKVNKIFTQCRIAPSKSIGGLSERQREEIVSMLSR